MIRILPALCGCVFSGMLRRGKVVTSCIASSDMNGLPGRYQREIKGECCAFARAALHANIAGVFLDDAVGDRESKASPAILAFRGRSLGSEKRVVDALNVFLGNS